MSEKVSERLKNRLLELKISQSKAGRMADVPQCSFNLIVNGKMVPCPSWRRRIAEVLQIPEEVLFAEYLNKRGT